MRRSQDTGLNPADHLTTWWARLLDSPWVTPRSSPSSESFWRFTVGAVLFFPISLLALVQGETTVAHRSVVVLLVFSVGLGVSAWIMYLRLVLRSQGLDDVSWYDMPLLTRGAGSRERRWLAQWRLATMAKLVLRVVLLLAIAAILVGPVAHNSAATATVKAQPTAAATPNPLAGIGPIVNTAKGVG